MISVNSLSHAFGSNVIYENISLELETPCMAYFMGKSGTGKSVLLRILCGKLIPNTGTTSVPFKPVLVFQQPILIDSLTVRENLELIIPQVTKDVYDRVRLKSNIENKLPSELSYGERKKLLILRALLKSPKLIFFDEPTTGLDRPTSRELSSLFLDIHTNEKISMLVVSHDMYCALEFSKQIVFLDNKKIIFQGSPEEIKRSKQPIIEEFLCSL